MAEAGPDVAEAGPAVPQNRPAPPSTFDGMVASFIMAVTHRRPDKLKEIYEIMSSDSSTLDCFSSIWGLREAHVKMTPPIFTSKKCDENSFIYWRLASTHLNRRDKDLALKYFNFSILLAPHPPLLVDDRVVSSDVMEFIEEAELVEGEPGRHNPDGWGDYVSLAYAYESRARLLLDMERYSECLRDIELVLELGCPHIVSTKLGYIKKLCEDNIEVSQGTSHSEPQSAAAASPSRASQSAGASPTKGKGSPVKGSASPTKGQSSPVKGSSSPKKGGSYALKPDVRDKNDPVSFQYRCPDPPTLINPSPSIPAFTDSVELAYSKTEGRYLVAGKTITHGEIVAVEEAYCCAVKLEYLRIYCVVCAKRTLAPLPCPGCSMVVFCSDMCRAQGLKGSHWKECNLLPTLFQLDMGANPLLAFKMFIKNGHLKLREMVPKVMVESTAQTPEQRGFNSDGVYDNTDYSTVYNLVTNKDKRIPKELLNRTMEAFMLLKLLKNGGRYFVDSEEKSIEPSEEELIFTGSLLLHHLMNFGCNGAGIYEVEIIGSEVEKNPIRVYGSAIFPATSLMSHSCYPNCVSLSYGSYRVLKACRAIPVGEPVTCQYIDALKGTLIERRARLLPQYFFICRCEACQKNWPQGLFYTSDFNLKCVKCHGMLNGNTKKCSRCNLNYSKRTAVPGVPQMYTYDYTTIKRKVDQVLKDYKRAEQRLIKKGNVSDADMRVVSNLIELYDSFVELPSYMHVAAQTTFNSMNYVLSSSAYSIEDSNPECPVS